MDFQNLQINTDFLVSSGTMDFIITLLGSWGQHVKQQYNNTGAQTVKCIY